MSNFRNLCQQTEPDLSTGQLVLVPGMSRALPLWFVKNLPTPNVGTGALLPFNGPTVNYAGSFFPAVACPGSYPVADFECKSQDRQ